MRTWTTRRADFCGCTFDRGNQTCTGHRTSGGCSISHSCSAPLRYGGACVTCPFPDLTPQVITVRVHFASLELDMYHLALYWTQCISRKHDWCVVPLSFLQWYNPIFLISRLNILILLTRSCGVSKIWDAQTMVSFFCAKLALPSWLTEANHTWRGFLGPGSPPLQLGLRLASARPNCLLFCTLFPLPSFL